MSMSDCANTERPVISKINRCLEKASSKMRFAEAKGASIRKVVGQHLKRANRPRDWTFDSYVTNSSEQSSTVRYLAILRSP